MYSEREVQAQLNKYLDLGLSPIWLKGKIAKYHWKDFKLTRDNMNLFIKPGTNWGLRSGLLPSGKYLWFIDLDSKTLLGDVLNSYPALLSAPIVSTGKGFHIYLTWLSKVKTRHVGKIDIIGNGYVVCPPSIHPNGKQYRFIRPLDVLPPLFNPDELALPEQTSPPPIIHSSLAPMLPYASFGQFGSAEFAGVPQGQRYNTLVRIIGIELARYFTEEETLSVALEWNKKNKPPMTKAEVINTLRDCYNRWDRYIPPAKSNN